MMISSAELRRAQRRGAVVKPKLVVSNEEPAQPELPLPDPNVEQIARSVAAVETVSQATRDAVHQMAAITTAVKEHLSKQQEANPKAAPVTYRFTIRRDDEGRLSEIVATPVENGVTGYLL